VDDPPGIKRGQVFRDHCSSFSPPAERRTEMDFARNAMMSGLPCMTFGSRAAVTVALVLVSALGTAAQQPASPPAAQLQSPPQVQPPQAEVRPPTTALPTPPDVIGAIGRFIDQSLANVGAGVRGAGETLGGATDAAGDLARGVTDAAGAVARLPLSNIVAGWERCAVAPNGAPDCGVASVALCKSKGFARGNSVDITTSRKCPAQVWLQGRTPTDTECVNESFVSRAICQ
jgi:hypothetical protein